MKIAAVLTALRLLDYLLTIVHLLIVGFDLLGWIWPKTRKVHFVAVCVTAGCWLILGMWFGIGYCPVTDWQWQLKEHLGEQNLPSSFIKYLADKITGSNISSDLIDWLTAAGFAMAVVLSVYLNFFLPKKKSV